MGLGAGYGQVNSEGSVGSASGVDFEAKYSGMGPVYELLIGGTPGAGLVVGGGFVGQDITDPDLEVEVGGFEEDELFELDGSLGLVLLGPFLDWFPEDRGGFHVGAMLGFGGIGLSGGDDDDVSQGWGGSFWAGYDFWVGDQWSLGVEGRAVYLATSRDLEEGGIDFGEVDDRGKGFQLLFTALYH